MVGLNQYWDLLGVPRIGTLMLSGVLGQLPVGMVTIALILAVTQRSDGYVMAGLGVAAYALGTGLAPVWGRAADRLGRRRVLLASATAFVVAMITLVLVLMADGPPTAIVMSALGAGATRPIIAGSLRSLWSHLARDERVLRTGYVLQSLQVEFAWLVGPLLVSLLTLVLGPTHGASAALVAAAGLAAMGAVLLAGIASNEASGNPGAPSSAIRLYTRRFITILGCAALFDAAAGASTLSIAAVTQRAGTPELTGVLIATWMTGSIIGGLAYGAATFPARVLTRYRVLLLFLAASYGVMALVTNPWVLTGVLLISGLAIAPALAVLYRLIAAVAARSDVRTEGFSWLDTVAAGGGAAGAVIGGALIDHFQHPWPGFGAAAASTLTASFLATYAAADPPTDGEDV